MKFRIFILLFLLTPLVHGVCSDIRLNQYGHIITPEQKTEMTYFRENDRDFISTDGFTLEGNCCYKIKTGYLTVVTVEDNVPSTLRLYSKDGVLQYKKQFRKIINLRGSDNKKFFAFFDGEDIVILDTETILEKRLPGSTLFAVNNKGIPILYDANSKLVKTASSKYHFDLTHGDILCWNEEPIIADTHQLYTNKNDNLSKIFSTNNIIFETKVFEDNLYVVERKYVQDSYIFSLYKISNELSPNKIDEVTFNRTRSKSHEIIIAPLEYGSWQNPLPIGNSYGEIQQYGGSPYLHPGVDFLGDDYENVYAVQSGFIKAILTTGGSAYWRIGIANNNTTGESEGYLYAHLNQSSIPYIVGDSVSTGDFIGTLYPWSVSGFTHTHFARIKSSGTTWNGNWWTTDNPLPDMLNVLDTIPPVFENAVGNDQFAFRTPSGVYLDPDHLMGEIDIIAKCHDIINSNWRVDVWDLRYELYPVDQPGTAVYELFSFAYDMPLDTYVSGSWDNMVLNTIYSRDATCFSVGDYTEREYYHIITHSDGDSTISANDQYEHLDTSQFDDGQYILKVIARDCAMNETSASMNITFDNVSNDNSTSEIKEFITVTPNPYIINEASHVTISFSQLNNSNESDLKIYDLRGRIVGQLIPETTESQTSFIWDGHDQNKAFVPTGIYIFQVTVNDEDIYGKFLLIR